MKSQGILCLHAIHDSKDRCHAKQSFHRLWMSLVTWILYWATFITSATSEAFQWNTMAVVSEFLIWMARTSIAAITVVLCDRLQSCIIHTSFMLKCLLFLACLMSLPEEFAFWTKPDINFNLLRISMASEWWKFWASTNCLFFFLFCPVHNDRAPWTILVIVNMGGCYETPGVSTDCKICAQWRTWCISSQLQCGIHHYQCLQFAFEHIHAKPDVVIHTKDPIDMNLCQLKRVHEWSSVCSAN